MIPGSNLSLLVDDFFVITECQLDGILVAGLSVEHIKV